MVAPLGTRPVRNNSATTPIPMDGVVAGSYGLADNVGRQKVKGYSREIAIQLSRRLRT
jgi:hypothetical protein